MSPHPLIPAGPHRSDTRVQIFVEYVMLAKVNDNPEQAHQLGRLLSHRPHQYMVNLIPWNPVYSPDISFEAPGPERLDEFHRVVRSHNIICTVRKEMGQEIEGACFFFLQLIIFN